MKSKFRFWGVSVLGLLASLSSLASDVVVIRLNDGGTELSQFKEIAHHLLPGKSIKYLSDKTWFFENSCTHVQLAPKKKVEPGEECKNPDIVTKDVILVLPSALNYKVLMEVLLKVKAAKNFGAQTVDVYSTAEVRDIKIDGPYGHYLKLEALLHAAGAKHAYVGFQKRALKGEKFEDLPEVRGEYYIGTSNYPELRDSIARSLNKVGKTFEDLHGSELSGSLRGMQLYWVMATNMPVDTDLFTNLAQIRWLRQNGVTVHLISPYLPYARGDKPEYDVKATASGRLAADLIQAVGTHSITVVRAHAPQSLAFFSIHAVELTGRSKIIEHLKNQGVEVIVSPDAGFQKDATKVADDLKDARGGADIQLVIMNKKRDSDGFADLPSGNGAQGLGGKVVAIVDDETASGGTGAMVAAFLGNVANPPKKIILAVNHLAGKASKALDSAFIHEVVVTDTIPIKITHEKLKVLPIADEIAKDIKRIEDNRRN